MPFDISIMPNPTAVQMSIWRAPCKVSGVPPPVKKRNPATMIITGATAIEIKKRMLRILSTTSVNFAVVRGLQTAMLSVFWQSPSSLSVVTGFPPIHKKSASGVPQFAGVSHAEHTMACTFTGADNPKEKSIRRDANTCFIHINCITGMRQTQLYQDKTPSRKPEYRKNIQCSIPNLLFANYGRKDEIKFLGFLP